MSATRAMEEGLVHAVRAAPPAMPVHTARTAWREEEVLTELHGRKPSREIETTPPWIRIDIVPRAALPWGQARPLRRGHRTRLRTLERA